LINNYSPNDNKNGKKKTKKHRFYYQSLEEKCVLDLVFSVDIHFQCHLELILLWKSLQLFTLSSSYFVNISFVQEGPCARARINRSFFLSKGGTTSFKPIYKCCGQQWGVFFIIFQRCHNFYQI
jgi:hypothetical protein